MLLLLPGQSYRAAAFIEAAARLPLELTVGSDHASTFAEQQPDRLLALDFAHPDRAARMVLNFTRTFPVSAVTGVDDDTAVLAAVIGDALGLPGNPPAATRAARDKYIQRATLYRHGVPVPDFALHGVGDDAGVIARTGRYPCVLKPLSLSASRGVIRANTPAEFIAAHRRLTDLLRSPELTRRPGSDRYLVEDFVSGPEFALEGLIVAGRLHCLALFDKPDPLEGPYFEETIYVTPSRLPLASQEGLTNCVARAATALGLTTGPVHAELRLNDRGPWLIELAARPIGGRCSAVLRFGEGADVSLEEVLLRHVTGMLASVPDRESRAAGVMMVPTPGAGRLLEVKGVEAAVKVPHVTGVQVTAHRGQQLVPLPEGARYLGFIFASAEQPEQVEQALREAHRRLEIVLSLASSQPACDHLPAAAP